MFQHRKKVSAAIAAEPVFQVPCILDDIRKTGCVMPLLEITILGLRVSLLDNCDKRLCGVRNQISFLRGLQYVYTDRHCRRVIILRCDMVYVTAPSAAFGTEKSVVAIAADRNGDRGGLRLFDSVSCTDLVNLDQTAVDSDDSVGDGVYRFSELHDTKFLCAAASCRISCLLAD